MGRNVAVLAERTLPPRRPSTGRMLIDLCENVHIHHRDIRTEFSVNEFRQYVAHLNDCARDIEGYLADNPEYREGGYRNTILVATGRAKLLDASPEPHRPMYWPDRMRVELIEPHSMGSVHVHWRDFRLHVTLAELREMAQGLSDAVKSLEAHKGYRERSSPSLDAVRRQCAKPPKKRPGKGHYRGLVG